jgi:hypothetical protein
MEPPVPVSAACLRPTSINLLVFSGRVTPSDLRDVVAFYAADGGAATGRDEIAVCKPGADLSAITENDMAVLTQQLGAIVRRAKLTTGTRTALVCQEPASAAIVDAWVALAQADLGETVLLPDIAAAGRWIGLSGAEIDALEAACRLPDESQAA